MLSLKSGLPLQCMRWTAKATAACGWGAAVPRGAALERKPSGGARGGCLLSGRAGGRGGWPAEAPVRLSAFKAVGPWLITLIMKISLLNNQLMPLTIINGNNCSTHMRMVHNDWFQRML